jgi:uncharacterized protein
MVTPQEIIDWLRLQANQMEGGFLYASYESLVKLPDIIFPNFPPTQNGRPLCSAIYYFLKSENISVMHKVSGDMIYHFYTGHPVQMLLLYPEGFSNQTEVFILNNNMEAGSSPMKLVPGGTWLGSRLTPGGDFALMGVTMAPGFVPIDYSIGNSEELIRMYPSQKELIADLTKIN